MNEGLLAFRLDDGLAHLTIDDPPKNELNRRFFDQLTTWCKEVLPTLDVRGLIISGRGRHFSSGANIEELGRMITGDTTVRQRFHDNQQAYRSFESAPFPVVAAISGCCFGAGFELALACDYRVASPNAVFALPEIQYGLIPGCGGTVHLPRIIPFSEAVELVLSGRLITAEEARKLGLVDWVVGRTDLFDAVRTAICRGNMVK